MVNAGMAFKTNLRLESLIAKFANERPFFEILLHHRLEFDGMMILQVKIEVVCPRKSFPANLTREGSVSFMDYFDVACHL